MCANAQQDLGVWIVDAMTCDVSTTKAHDGTHDTLDLCEAILPWFSSRINALELTAQILYTLANALETIIDKCVWILGQDGCFHGTWDGERCGKKTIPPTTCCYLHQPDRALALTDPTFEDAKKLERPWGSTPIFLQA